MVVMVLLVANGMVFMNDLDSMTLFVDIDILKVVSLLVSYMMVLMGLFMMVVPMLFFLMVPFLWRVVFFCWMLRLVRWVGLLLSTMRLY